MKPIVVVLMVLMQINSYAQQPLSAQQLNQEGYRYLKGIGKPYKPEEAVRLFHQSASLGNAMAMNALGNIYVRGIGVNANTDSALYWYTAALAGGYASANLNLGRIYKNGVIVKQDFEKAVAYYKQGVALQDNESKNALAYMYYKGLGTAQDYYKAFDLFLQSAEQGSINSMYFLGLCYRNGYGTPVNTDLSKQWLTKAALSQDRQSIHELQEEPLPENRSTVSAALENQLAGLKRFQEKYQASDNNNYEGIYAGYAVYYDWSGKNVSDIQSVTLVLQKQGSGYSGSWKEGDNPAAPIALNAAGNMFTFNPGSVYSRTDHYSDRKPEKWQFNQAQLQLGFADDSVQLSGYVQFYSDSRKEPGKPLQVILKRAVAADDAILKGIQFVLIPNPARAQTITQFTLAKAARISIVISSQNGAVLYTEADKLLPAGSYNYPVNISSLAAGVYDVSIKSGGRIIATRQLIKQ